MSQKKVTITIGDINICIEGIKDIDKNNPTVIQENEPPFTNEEFTNFVKNKELTEERAEEIGKELYRILKLEGKKEHIRIILKRREGITNKEIAEKDEKHASSISSMIQSSWRYCNNRWKKEHLI